MGVAVETTPEFRFEPPRVMVDGGFTTDYPGGNTPRMYDVSLDGQQFLTLQSAVSGADVDTPQINIVQNWFEELKERVPVP